MASDVLLDASVLCHFAKHGLVEELRDYLGDRARITPDVEREVLRLLGRSEFGQLHDYLTNDGAVVRREGKWPKRTKNLPDALKAEFSKLLDLKRAIGEHERAHAGEIATVLMAKHRSSELVIMDDNWGSDLARNTYGLEVMSTARLALEMVAGGALSEDEGFAVFDSATPNGVGRKRYKVGLRRLRS
jgi:predicted nucleic acid-binding protein